MSTVLLLELVGGALRFGLLQGLDDGSLSGDLASDLLVLVLLQLEVVQLRLVLPAQSEGLVLADWISQGLLERPWIFLPVVGATSLVIPWNIRCKLTVRMDTAATLISILALIKYNIFANCPNEWHQHPAAVACVFGMMWLVG